jgi:NaMN:DMB phosphoribosyltransferase
VNDLARQVESYESNLATKIAQPKTTPGSNFDRAMLRLRELNKQLSAAPALFCISALPPGSGTTAAHVCKRVRERIAGGMIYVGLW